MRVHIFNEDENIVKENHVCYYTTPDHSNNNDLVLMEVVEVFYKHPQAPEHAIIPVYDTRQVKKVSRLSYEGGSSVLLEANQKAIYREEKK